MAVGVTKVEAESTTRPRDTALYGDAGGFQMFGPGSFVFLGDRECQMHLALAMVRRDDAAGCSNRLGGPMLHEEQEDLLAGNIEGAKSVVSHERAEAEDALIESDRAGEIVNVERSFEDAADSRHGFASMVQSKSCRGMEHLTTRRHPEDFDSRSGRVAQLAEQLTLNQ